MHNRSEQRRPEPVTVHRLALEPSADGASFATFQAMSASMCPVDLAEGTAEAFWFRSTLYQSPRALVFRAASSGHTARRGPAEIAQGNAHFWLQAQMGGLSETSLPGRAVRLAPGDVALYDYAQGFEGRQSPYDIIVLQVPRDRVPAAFLEPGVNGTHIPATEAAGRLIHRAAVALFDTAADLGIPAFEAAVDGICQMMAGALHGRTSGTEADDAAFAARAQALALIERSLHEPDLSPARIEAQTGLSRSSLYRLFAPLGGVGAVVLSRRLDRSLAALFAGAVSKPALGRIATKIGFRDRPTFERAFRRRFGLSPLAFAEMVSRNDEAGLTAQARREGFVTLPAWREYLAGQDDPARR